MIDAGNVTWIGMKGDVVCRPSDWKDVVRFFFVNYGLHAVTALTDPGSGAIVTLAACLISVLFPYTGLFIAVYSTVDVAIRGGSNLEKAKLAGALVMVVPKEKRKEKKISPSLINIHGQHPLRVRTLANTFSKAFWARGVSRDNHDRLEHPEDPSNSRFNEKYHFVIVPESHKVQPLMQGTKYDFELSSNYSILKSLAAVAQLVYGSYELYAARANQFDKFGYAAYSLTIIPYVFMSLLNLVGALSRHSYPAMYIVYYRGEVIPEEPLTDIEVMPNAGKALTANEGSPLVTKERPIGHREEWMKEVESQVAGSVGYTYGDLRKSSDGRNRDLVGLGSYLSAIPLPYIITYALTGFQKGESTISQRSLILLNLIWCQLSPVLLLPVTTAVETLLKKLFGTDIHGTICDALASVLMSAPTVAMFVTVARMILQDQVCSKI